jgi:hypothetical protein
MTLQYDYMNDYLPQYSAHSCHRNTGKWVFQQGWNWLSLSPCICDLTPAGLLILIKNLNLYSPAPQDLGQSGVMDFWSEQCFAALLSSKCSESYSTFGSIMFCLLIDSWVQCNNVMVQKQLSEWTQPSVSVGKNTSSIQVCYICIYRIR